MRFSSGTAGALWLLLATSAVGQVPLPRAPAVATIGDAITFEVAPGGSRTFAVSCPDDGTISVWVTSTTLDTTLRIIDPRGATNDDDDGGGRPTPHLLIDVAAGDVVQVTAGAKTGSADDAMPAESATLFLRGLVETAATREEAEPVQDDMAEARELQGEGEATEARELLQQRATRLLAVDGGSRSHLVGTASHRLALAIAAAGDLSLARALQERVLAIRVPTLPEDHPHLLAARGNYAQTLVALGDLTAARVLQERILATRLHQLPEEHLYVQIARGDLARTLSSLGHLHDAHALQEQVLALLSRRLPEEAADLQAARGNLALTLKALGDLPAARALEERVLAVAARTPPDGGSHLQTARSNLAQTLVGLGDLPAARVLLEQVLAELERTLPEEHPDLQRARGNLAATLSRLGDVAAACALEERVLAVRMRTLPEDHPHLQVARGNLAASLTELGDHAGARALQERVLDVLTRTMPEEHPALQKARINLGTTLGKLGDHAAARRLVERALAVFARTLPDTHPDLQTARANLAITIAALGDRTAARALEERVLEVSARTLPAEHPKLRSARSNLALTLLALEDLPAARDIAIPLLQGTRGMLRVSRDESMRSTVGGDVRCSLSTALSVDRRQRIKTQDGGAGDDNALRIEAASLIEEFRASTERRARLQIALAAERGDPESDRIVREWRTATARLAQMAESGDATGTRNAGIAREAAARALRDRLAAKGAGVPETVFDATALRAGLGSAEAAVSFWRYAQSTAIENEQGRSSSLAHDIAFVFTRAAGPDLVDLGPAVETDRLISAWRAALGRPLRRGLEDEDSEDAAARERGLAARLRERLIDPVLAKAGAAITTLFVTPSSPIAVLPLDALAGADGEPLGEHLRFETLTSLVALTRTRAPIARPPSLLALGGVDYDDEPEGPEALEGESESTDGARLEAAAVAPSSAAIRGPGEKRETWARAFRPLAKTEAEVEDIGVHFRRAFGRGAPREVLLEREASKESFLRLAPAARFLHFASHGYFAPESIPTTASEAVLDAKTGVRFLSASEQVRGLAPSLLCGLVFAGANLGPERVDGILTAEELMHMNLSGCELAVLSACETAVGLERAGLMIGTLRDAIHAAGAHRAITSLWQVGDKATMELMTDFYRRLWREKKDVSTALWEAKMRLRSLKNSRGEPKYEVADWAAFIASGVPRR